MTDHAFGRRYIGHRVVKDTPLITTIDRFYEEDCSECGARGAFLEDLPIDGQILVNHKVAEVCRNCGGRGVVKYTERDTEIRA